MTRITKRNGSMEGYDGDKIVSAVLRAMASAGVDTAGMDERVRELLPRYINPCDGMTVEDIQDGVEDMLMDTKMFATAKAYIKYREKHRESRFIRERLDYMDRYSRSKDNAATASETDPNANVAVRNAANLEGEVFKETNRLIHRQRMKDKLNEMFPEVARQYEKDLDSHVIYAHDEAVSPVCKEYCCAISTYPLLLEGTGNIDGVTPGPPNDIQSFSGQVTNLVFLVSSQVRGAVAAGDYMLSLNYNVIKEFGEDWHLHLDDVTTTGVCMARKTVKDCIRKGMKQFIYGVNQPAGNRSYNSPFTNISYYDRNYFDALFHDYAYPDGTKPRWEDIDTLQRIFMELHRELRLVKPLTFPVTTMSLLHDGNDVIDKEYKQLCMDEWAKGGSFFCYLSDNAEALSSCCFSGDTKLLWKSSVSGVQCTTFEECKSLAYDSSKRNFRVFHNGCWVQGNIVRLPGRQMYRVVTYNNKEFLMTDNHVNVTLDGEKPTETLTTDDYLMFNTAVTQPIKENDEHLTYEQGFVVGAFLGDGSFGAMDPNTGTIYETHFSQNAGKYARCMEMVDRANEQVGGTSKSRLGSVHNNVYPIRVSSKELVAFIQRWTNWERGTRACNKRLNLDCLLQSVEFRQGILDGWYNTDGGNSNRCYTTSRELAEGMEILIMSLGCQSIINVSDMTDEEVVIRGEHYNRNHPLYCVRWYDRNTCRRNRDPHTAWIKKNNSIYFRIKSIEKVDCDGDVYCVECKNAAEPYFTLPSGLITHNCRVRNDISDNTFSSTIGMIGIMTGSANVITLNVNRIVQDFSRESKDRPDMRFDDYLETILKRVYKYQIAYKTMLYDMEDLGMFSQSNANYIRMSKLYCTIGIIGYCEAAMFLGLKVGDNKEYRDFLTGLLGTIKRCNAENSIRDAKRPFIFNCEAIPGEGLAVKFYDWDKRDGYVVPKDQNLYSSYFYLPWDDSTTILDKLRLHGGDIAEACSGGQACHVNLDSHLSAEQYGHIINFCIRNRVNYFTFNIPMSECQDCGHVVNAPIKECPICGSDKVSWWTRIIGYLTKIDNWSKERRIEAKRRVFANGREEIKVS